MRSSVARAGLVFLVGGLAGIGLFGSPAIPSPTARASTTLVGATWRGANGVYQSLFTDALNTMESATTGGVLEVTLWVNRQQVDFIDGRFWVEDESDQPGVSRSPKLSLHAGHEISLNSALVRTEPSGFGTLAIVTVPIYDLLFSDSEFTQSIVVDLRVHGAQNAHLSFPVFVSESPLAARPDPEAYLGIVRGGGFTGELIRSAALTTPEEFLVTVTGNLELLTMLSVPPTVTIPAGETAARFDVEFDPDANERFPAEDNVAQFRFRSLSTGLEALSSWVFGPALMSDADLDPEPPDPPKTTQGKIAVPTVVVRNIIPKGGILVGPTFCKSHPGGAKDIYNAEREVEAQAAAKCPYPGAQAGGLPVIFIIKGHCADHPTLTCTEFTNTIPAVGWKKVGERLSTGTREYFGGTKKTCSFCVTTWGRDDRFRNYSFQDFRTP